MSARARFARLTAKECGHLIWKGPRNQAGQPVFKVGRRRVSAARYAWDLADLPLPGPRNLRRGCTREGCIAPEHRICAQGAAQEAI